MLDELKALREKADIEGRNAELRQFRTDFEAVWHYWRATGQISEQELVEGRADASRAVREHLGDAEWMACAMRHFRAQAAAIEADVARSDRIRKEVRRNGRRSMGASSPSSAADSWRPGNIHPDN